MKGPVFLEIKVKKGARKYLGCPATTPVQNKEIFQEFLKSQISHNTRTISN
jgi:phosphonopyruvate decarboxylase